MKVNVGDTVCIKAINNAARYKKEQDLLSDAVVTEVKKKYFKVDTMEHTRFIIETGYEDGKGYCSDHICYESKQDAYDEIEMNKKLNDIRLRSIKNVLKLEQVRAVHSIMFGDGES